jgi:hypothetical protein
MWEIVNTGPEYDEIVDLMRTYRRLAARTGSAKHSTEVKLHDRLEDIWEDMNLKLNELSDTERSALTCWKSGTASGTYEIDYDALTSKPYVSIRKVERVTEERYTKQSDRDAQSERVQSAMSDSSNRNKARALLNALRDD